MQVDADMAVQMDGDDSVHAGQAGYTRFMLPFYDMIVTRYTLPRP